MKKTLSIIIITLLIITTNIISAYAVDNDYKVEFVSEKTVVRGDEITVVVKVSNFKEGAAISLYSATLVYDGKVFESIQAEDIQGLNGWTHSASSFNENDTSSLGTGCRFFLEYKNITRYIRRW